MKDRSAPQTLRSLESLRDYFDGATSNITKVMDGVALALGAISALIHHAIRLKNRVDDLERKLNSIEKFD